MTIQKNKNIVGRKIHGSFFLIDIADHYTGDKCALYEINQTGQFLWNQIDGSRSTEDLVCLLKAAIVDEVDEQILYTDVSEFINVLLAKQFVEEKEDGRRIY